MAKLRIRGAAHWSFTPMRHVLAPMQDFVASEASSGVVLIAATAAALVLANSPVAAGYSEILHTKVGFTAGSFKVEETLLHWINDGLMAVFFFLAGLEIKREMWAGELSTVRAALLPALAAVGGAAVPALIYALLNGGGTGAAGWGVPMATDIAFALGILALLGSRVPFGLKVLLTAIAIIDDLIAVLVIALFYSNGANLGALGLAFLVLAIMLAGNLLGVRGIPFYALLGTVVWFAFLESGVHATVAGVLVALTVPVRVRIDGATFLQQSRSILDGFEHSSKREPYSILQDEEQQAAVLELEELSEAVQAPLQKMEHSLHRVVAFGIVPIFALANAGVSLSGGLTGSGTGLESTPPDAGTPVVLGVVLALVIGKPLGLLGATWLAVRAGVAHLPEGVGWSHIWGLAFLGGVGFTMSLFVASLAFEQTPALLEASKLGILGASLIAGTAGYLLLRRAGAERGVTGEEAVSFVADSAQEGGAGGS